MEVTEDRAITDWGQRANEDVCPRTTHLSCPGSFSIFWRPLFLFEGDLKSLEFELEGSRGSASSSRSNVGSGVGLKSGLALEAPLPRLAGGRRDLALVLALSLIVKL